MFYLEVDKDSGLLSPDAAMVAEVLRKKAWRDGEAPDKYYKLITAQDMENRQKRGHPWGEDAVPVGSLAFAEAVLGREDGIRPLNVPPCLRDSSYICRRIEEAEKKDIPGYFRRWNTDSLFLKSQTVPKGGITGLYSRTDPIDQLPDDSYMVSEPISFLAEWRCFVYKGIIRDIRRYAGSFTVPFLPCDIEFAKDIVKTVSAGVHPRLDAYTLDLGKTPARDIPVVVELHNFISCGLYGFEDPVIIKMLAAAAEREREHRPD